MNNSTDLKQKPSANRIRQIWQAITKPNPFITDKGDQRQAQLLAGITSSLTVLLTLVTLITVLVKHALPSAVSVLLPVIVFLIFAYILGKSQDYSFGSWMLVIIISYAAYAEVISQAKITPLLAPILGIVFLIGSALFSPGELLFLVGGNIILIPFLYFFVPHIVLTDYVLGIASGIGLGGFTLILAIFRQRIDVTQLEDIRRLTGDLNDTRSTLENRVSERTVEMSVASEDAKRRANQLEAVSDVARAIAQLQDLSDLLPTITQLISQRLDIYHVGIFLLDENQEYAVLRASNSEGGQKMLARGHRLRVGQEGMVGYVAKQAVPRISLDVGEDAVFFDNPDLPGTRSEMAIPLKTGDRVIGVLDVQSEGPAAFGHHNEDVMGTLADQVAIAIENARLFGEMQRALMEAQVSYGQYLRQAWEQLPLETRSRGYRYTGVQADIIDSPLDFPEIQKAIKTGEIVTQSEKNSFFAIPLKLRDEVIGVLDIRAKTPNREWSEDERTIVQAIADRVASALEIARLFEETTRRADRERAVSEITTRIRNTTDPQTMLQTALDELKHVLGAGDINIRPYKTQQKEEQKAAARNEKSPEHAH